jgi:DNA mismatch repair protein MutS
MAQLTPMMQQYLQVKQQHPDCILFFRLGDFYEMFQDDARTASKELDLTLTTRDRNKEEQTPMCGVPYHSAESYIARLVAKGYKVAICEQMEDPALAKGLVRRDITRIVTPGTVTESSMLDESRNNYFACVFAENGAWGLSFCDVSTGAFFVTSAEGEAALARVISELGRFSPAQVLRGGEAAANETLSDTLRDKLACCADIGDDSLFAQELTAQTLEAQFGKTPEALGLSDTAGRSAGALLYTLHELQKSPLSHIQMPEYYLSGRFMELDMTAVRNLELTQTLRGGEKRGSLLWTLDKTKTALGSRLLRSWLEKPSLNPKQIKQRLDAVEELTKNTIEREELIHMLEDATDLERVMARIVTGSANARDLLALRNGCLILPHLRAALPRLDAPLFAALYEELDGLEDISDLLRTAIVDEPPFTVREGGMIREGYHEELDFLRDILHGGKGTLAEIELAEKEKTGIRTLRVGYNRVFGYYIEVSKGQSALVPEHYIRKQTLANGERYITEELKTLESTILGAKERANTLEYELFSALREKLSEQAGRVQRSARAVASLDVLSCFASIAVSRNYCKPEVDLSGEISIRDGRHPVVEQVLKDSLFVPNDTALDTANNRVAIITGPNMAGKSTYMRQVALIVLMAQIGSFVPAKDARIGIVDRIFTRIGASDDLSSGQSTFMGR